RKLSGVDPSLHSFHLFGRSLLSTWSSHAKHHSAAAAAVSADWFVTVQPAKIDQRSAEPAGVHRVFNEIFVWKRNADLPVAAHLTIAKDATILAVYLKALDFL